MPQIQGLAAHAAGAELLPFRYDPGKLGSQEVEIAITHCGICHSDLHLISNDWGISHYPFIPGHEIVGTVSAVGNEVRGLEVGQRVGLGWQSNSCGVCEWCLQGLENLCPEAEGTCVHRHGGYADRVRANARFVIPIPDASGQASRRHRCCAAASRSTAQCARMASTLRRGWAWWASAGWATWPSSLPASSAREVTAFSTSAAKEKEARALGADDFVNSRESKAMKDVAGSLDFILTTANADQDWGTYLQALRPTGTLCFVGVPPSPVSVHAFPLISGMRTMSGSPVGSPYGLREMLDVAARHGVKATTELFPMTKANEAIEKVKKNKVRYRAVLAN